MKNNVRGSLLPAFGTPKTRYRKKRSHKESCRRLLFLFFDKNFRCQIIIFKLSIFRRKSIDFSPINIELMSAEKRFFERVVCKPIALGKIAVPSSPLTDEAFLLPSELLQDCEQERKRDKPKPWDDKRPLFMCLDHNHTEDDQNQQ